MIISPRISPALLLSLTSLLLPLYASAHTGSEFYEQVVGEHKVDVGYTTKTPAQGDPVQFDFILWQGKAQASFDDVWVRIESPDGVTVLATGIHNSAFGGPRLSYVFPSAGNYTVFVRYEDASSTIAESSFPMIVRAASAQKPAFDYGYLLAVLGMGMLLGAALPRLWRLRRTAR